MHHKRASAANARAPQQRQRIHTRAHRWATSLAAAVISIGGGVAMAAPAIAAPGDAITMPDDALRACINTDLGQSDTDPITEAQAGAITEVKCRNKGITDLTGLESMPQLQTAWLDNNPGIVSRAPLMNLDALRDLGLWNAGVTEADLAGLSGLPNLYHLNVTGNGLVDIGGLAHASASLTVLYLGGNDIADVSPLAFLPDLRNLHLGNNRIADVSLLAGLTGLTNLYLDSNEITDISSLSALARLGALNVSRQSIDLPSAPLGAATANPVIDIDGDPVVVDSADTGFSYDGTDEAWAFSTRGNKTLSWNTPVSIGSVTDVEFSGAISQRISFAQAVPEDPSVTQAVCMNGDVVYPQITLPVTEGITYDIVGAVVPGATVTVTAVPADDDHAVYVDPDSDWVDASGDHIYATLEITLDEPDCTIVTPEPTVIDPPNGDLPVDDPCGPDNATWILPTGDDVSEGFTWKVTDDGLLIAEANNGYIFDDAAGLDPMMREYGYAPDTGEVCPPAPETPQTPDGLAATGGSAPVIGGAAAATLLLLGGLLLAVRRRRVV